MLTPEPVLREISDIAREAGAHVLVDEVYLDAVYENRPRTAFHLGSRFVLTSSLTKIYGVSGLRCGWILAKPELTRAMWRSTICSRRRLHPGELLQRRGAVHMEAVANTRATVRPIAGARRFPGR